MNNEFITDMNYQMWENAMHEELADWGIKHNLSTNFSEEEFAELEHMTFYYADGNGNQCTRQLNAYELDYLKSWWARFTTVGEQFED